MALCTLLSPFSPLREKGRDEGVAGSGFQPATSVGARRTQISNGRKPRNRGSRTQFPLRFPSVVAEMSVGQVPKYRGWRTTTPTSHPPCDDTPAVVGFVAKESDFPTGTSCMANFFRSTSARPSVRPRAVLTAGSLMLSCFGLPAAAPRRRDRFRFTSHRITTRRGPRSLSVGKYSQALKGTPMHQNESLEVCKELKNGQR